MGDVSYLCYVPSIVGLRLIPNANGCLDMYECSAWKTSRAACQVDPELKQTLAQ